jgi:hypothetical protein
MFVDIEGRKVSMGLVTLTRNEEISKSIYFGVRFDYLSWDPSRTLNPRYCMAKVRGIIS